MLGAHDFEVGLGSNDYTVEIETCPIQFKAQQQVLAKVRGRKKDLRKYENGTRSLQNTEQIITDKLKIILSKPYSWDIKLS